MSEPKITRRKLADYSQTPHNPNRHTERGLQIIEDSANYNGAGRSGLVDKHGTLLAGNGAWEAMARAGIEDVLEVETDGHAWVIVKRTDLEDGTPKAEAIKISDNRASELGLSLDNELMADLLVAVQKESDELLRAAGYYDSELDELIAALQRPDTDLWGNALGGLADGDRAPFQQMTFTLHDEQAAQITEALRIAKALGPFDSSNENSNGNALARICETYLTDHGQS